MWYKPGKSMIFNKTGMVQRYQTFYEKSFWNFREKLSIIDGIVVKGNCIVIPTKFQPELLSLLDDSIWE